MVLRERYGLGVSVTLWSVLMVATLALSLLAACGTRRPQQAAGTAASEEQAGAPSNDEKDAAEGVAVGEESDAVDAKKASLLYMGQASVRITTAEGKIIYVDPYAGPDEWYAPAADLVLVTHDHFDHCAVERVAHRAEECVTITHNEAVVDGEHPTFELGYATVVPVQAGFNALHDVNRCVGYVIVLSDGTSVYLTGDTSTTDDMRDGTLAAMGIDYAFWCCDGVYNMGLEEAAEAAAMVGAAHNVPYHNSTTNTGEMFDREEAERFAAPNAMVVYPGKEIEL